MVSTPSLGISDLTSADTGNLAGPTAECPMALRSGGLTAVNGRGFRPGPFPSNRCRKRQRTSTGLRGRLGALAGMAVSAIMVLSGSAPALAHDLVGFGDAAPGTIVVRTSERRLYYVVEPGRAIRYPVGVGKAGRQWAGRTYIDGKYLHPAWSPPSEVRHDKPYLPDFIPGGAPSNPMGVAAMTLNGGEYAIHGTNKPSSVGHFVSYGCIRMYNQDIVDLYGRVGVGTPVVVTQ
jgi:lipoprotein-anchoring transpeptidase ErfK/SrfK